ncbi:hypothetical protein SCB71_13685 [Herbiconiux sp. KACC 21604]|uniref:hypothetical protein n=1 Tax=unclassified Herbiconiux TaxID=2618217 RepID=UPI0014923D78|nr:hypothetical protein [Herbiconiux sp. SALV-R1]QJU54206.1 hypothetical protein HL652_11640 [Herbiconiux sp. SALV-R1]WPO85263.1 hypothetical protein SCB71_13685 [Herbiconiux sp. KACC 21604]
MRVLPSALRHGITEQEIRAGLQVPMRRVALERDVLLVIGAGNAAELLEIVVADVEGDDPRVIHAMPWRPKFHRYL